MTLGPRFDAWLTTPPEDCDDDDPIHAAGWNAAENGEPLGVCPYLVGTEEYERWEMGWNDYAEDITWMERE